MTSLRRRVLATPTGRKAHAAYARIRLPILRTIRGRRRVNLGDGTEITTFGTAGWQTFFGYYDISPFDRSETRLLALRTRTTAPQPSGPAELVIHSLSDSRQPPRILGSTRAWCWQQGCRLRWWNEDHILLNDRERDGFAAVVRDTRSGHIQHRFARPLYDVTADHRMGLSLNFERLEALRPGYGYGGTGYWISHPAPADDGIWTVDLGGNSVELLLSLQEAAELEPHPSMVGAVHYFNHLSCSPDSAHVMAFHLWDDGRKRHSRALIINLATGRVRVITPEPHVSHYAWRDSQTILLTATHPGEGFGYHLYSIETGWRGKLVKELLTLDGHPSYHPRQPGLVLTDTYPDRHSERQLLLLDLSRHAVSSLASFFSPPRLTGPTRCDLHPRWSPSGRHIVVDSAHAGWRQMVVVRQRTD